jgi:transitional endoplasmic reticulum ATPase
MKTSYVSSVTPTAPANLSPSQAEAYRGLTAAISTGPIAAMWGGSGVGKTRVLRALHGNTGGAFLNARDMMDSIRRGDPRAIEESFELRVLEALASESIAYVDDLHLLTTVTLPCGYNAYPRNGLMHVALKAVCDHVEQSGKRLVLGSEGSPPGSLGDLAYTFGIDEFEPEDYAFICREYLEESAARLDFGKVHRFAPKLNAYQLRNACIWLRSAKPDTETFIEYLRSQQMASNVDLGEVQEVDLHDLQGIDDLIRALEANIILPLENDALAQELDIRPKRGVLLAGPPGTGKTTVGRALAHRLRSKFFMIDGTFVSGTPQFYQRIHQVFEAAKQNAPSIIFIDDSDVIFESGGEMGLYRYLLTMLDGLESASAGRVCVMLTAMDVGNLPPALIRSGRIELWLETRLPDEEARESILHRLLGGLPAAIGPVDATRLSEQTEGLTGADLKRLVDDGKILFAYDRATNRPLRPATEYFLDAIETVRANKERYAEAEAQARERHPNRPSMFDMFGGMMAGMAMAGDD